MVLPSLYNNLLFLIIIGSAIVIAITLMVMSEFRWNKVMIVVFALATIYMLGWLSGMNLVMLENTPLSFLNSGVYIGGDGKAVSTAQSVQLVQIVPNNNPLEDDMATTPFKFPSHMFNSTIYYPSPIDQPEKSVYDTSSLDTGDLLR